MTAEKELAGMIQIGAAILAGMMMIGVALWGLRPRARLAERFYSAATGGWSALGAAIYYPALYGRFAPVGLIHNHLDASGNWRDVSIYDSLR